MIGFPRPCLMLITEPVPLLADVVAEAVAGGVDIVQWREKRVAGAGYFHLLAQLNAAISDKALLSVNGNWEGAIKRGIKCIHLPEASVPIGVVRHRVGTQSLIGKSVHSVASAQKAAAQGADYLAAGAIFASSSHPEIAPAGLDFLAEVCAAVTIPVVAIGGVTPNNALSCLRAGAAGIAVLSGIMQAPSVRRATREYRDALDASWKDSSCS